MKVSPAKRRKGIYKFLVTEDVCYNTNIKKEFENEWLKIEKSGKMTVKGTHGNGYAWDGCTPKFNIFDILLIGTPDGRVNINTGKPITYYASLIHDILCQFRNEIPISRKDADKVFHYYLGDFELKFIYYAAVRTYSVLSSGLRN